MELEQFKLQCPILLGNEKMFGDNDKALLAQGEFFKTHTFVFAVLEPIEERVVRLHSGMDTGKVESWADIARKIDENPTTAYYIEARAYKKLKDPKVIEALMEYTDETFALDDYKKLKYSKKELLMEEVLNSLNADNLKKAKELSIMRLPLEHKYAKSLTSRLHRGGIKTCADLIMYMRCSKDFMPFGIGTQYNSVIANGVCSLIESGYVDITDGSAYASYLKYKELEGEPIIKAQFDNMPIDEIQGKIAKMKIEKLGFSTRTFHCLKRIKEPRINTVGDLVEFYKYHYPLSESIKGFGKQSEQEVMDKLIELGAIKQQENTQEVDVLGV